VTPRRRLFLGPLALAVSACASTPPAPPPAPPPSYEQKLGWILRLEDQRVLRDPAQPTAPAIAEPQRGSRIAAPAPPPVADLAALTTEADARLRRRSALAIGRVGLEAGVPPLVKLLESDPEPEVRQMAAFALGLIGRDAAVAPLENALADEAPVVRGRAAEALGLIGSASSARAIGAMVSAYVKAGAVARAGPDDATEAAPDLQAVGLGIFALTRLKSYDVLAGVLLDGSDAPVTGWWPAAYALSRAGDPRAIPALRHLVQAPGIYTRSFAARGLGRLGDRDAVPLLTPLVAGVKDAPGPAVEAVRALGDIARANALPVLVDLLKVRGVHPGIRAEAVTAIGKLKAPESVDVLLDLISDRAAVVRAAALSALAAVDPQRFIETLSGLGPDPQWQVRAALARALGTLPAGTAAPLLETMTQDEDQRVLPAVLEGLVASRSPRAARVALDKLTAADPVVRAAAASALGELKPEGAVQALVGAARFAERDALYVARTSALAALAGFGREAAEKALTSALTDKDWAVRVRAAELLHTIDPSRDDQAAIRPAPTRLAPSVYSAPEVVSPEVSTELYIDTDQGTIQVELAVLDAPLTARTLTDLARQGYFGGVVLHRVVPDFVVQDGDPRGDGEGGPGYTIRDELNERPFVRGAVGMALDWRDSGGSQFFIAVSPQPHLDARYTVIGRVVSGMDVVDKLDQGDLIRGIRVWDGSWRTTPPAGAPREAH
jgi:HEAT repeat protein/cyclophilin family peptidyl-prolyl cis-trans isomerase